MACAKSNRESRGRGAVSAGCGGRSSGISGGSSSGSRDRSGDRGRNDRVRHALSSRPGSPAPIARLVRALFRVWGGSMDCTNRGSWVVAIPWMENPGKAPDHFSESLLEYPNRVSGAMPFIGCAFCFRFSRLRSSPQAAITRSHAARARPLPSPPGTHPGPRAASGARACRAQSPRA